jgi:radical SAM superfamily enzyme YgiQ (UPF0313 family)
MSGAALAGKKRVELLGGRIPLNILLIYPQFPDTFWSFRYALKFVGRKSAFPPLGLLTVAAMLPEDWGKRLVDLNVRSLRQKDLSWADCVFISAMAVQRQSVRDVLDRCRKAGLMTVGGGPLFTCEPEAFPEIDHLILNEAETTLPQFLADLKHGSAQRAYSDTTFPDIGATPVPLWHLADLKRYGSMNLQYSRGCPFDCEFCNITALFGHRPRVKKVHQVTEELNRLWDLGWRESVFFVDDNFLGNKRELKEHLLPALITWRNAHPNIPFNTEISINLADDADLMRLMVQAGFDTVFIGIETPNEDSLEECGKSQNQKRDLLADVHRIQHAGLQVQGGFIVGFDSDTPGIFQRQIDFIQKSGIATAMVGLLEALPGTRLYERLKGENRLLASETSGDNVDASTNIIPRMDLETLREGYKRIMHHLYTPKHYYRRVHTFLQEYTDPQIRMSLSLDRMLAGFRSIVHLGILGRERIHYWRLMTWTLLHRPALLSLAVTLSIYGSHFRKICDRHLR